jgi:hypothetical protein
MARPNRKKRAKKIPKPPKKRNLAAKQARDQKPGPMKDKRGGRGGARNVMQEALKDAERAG